jgi:23S rRNA (adenine-N6)-dimethyltransferase
VAVRRRPAREAPGQHFLRSKRLAADLVADVELTCGDLVVEIGGGTGVLTKALAQTGAEVVVIERDRLLADRLRARFDADTRVEIAEADAAKYDWPTRPFSVVANLPFAHSGEILAGLLRDPRVPLQMALVIVQWEFAAKQAAVWPATLRSTYWRAWFDVSIARRLDRAAFAPPPQVDAGVLRLQRRARARVAVDLHDMYWRFLEDAFATNAPIRSALRTVLPPLQIKRLAPALGFGAGSHARDLDAGQWARLFARSREAGVARRR